MVTSIRSLVAALAATFASLALVPATTLAATTTAAKTVVCKDGTTDEGGRGACRGHGGVDKAATAKAQGGSAGAKADTKAEAKAKNAQEKADAKAKKEKAKAEEAAPAATVVCKDGSTSKAGRGACRGHGGVDKGGVAKAAAPSAAPVPTAPVSPVPQVAPSAPVAPKAAAPVREKADAEKGPPSARCKDGTLSYSKHHTGACSRHGGVAEWLDKK